MNLCLYHGGKCLDGFVSAWVVSQFFPQADFVPANYGDAPPNVSGMDVVIVDFSWPRAALLEMKKKAKSLVVLDHHKTAEADLKGLDFCVFDMEKSGARLAWEFFSDDSKSPWLVDYAEDADLWRWALPYSREVKAYLHSIPWTFEAFDQLVIKKGDSISGVAPLHLVDQGAAILRFKEQMIEAAIRHATEIEMDGHKVMCANVSSTELISDVGHRLAIDRPFSVTYFKKGNTTVYSLRSTPDGIDVSEVAKQHGGGGHRNAAGFNVVWNGTEPEHFSGVRTEQTKAAIAAEDGPLRHDVTVDEATGRLRIVFSKPVKDIELDRGTALTLAKNLRSKAEGL
jgi:oligoribonuclease NrnB/cAMP/cGMP phosphodiesterase (DHH superfamily)